MVLLQQIMEGLSDILIVNVTALKFELNYLYGFITEHKLLRFMNDYFNSVWTVNKSAE